MCQMFKSNTGNEIIGRYFIELHMKLKFIKFMV